MPQSTHRAPLHNCARRSHEPPSSSPICGRCAKWHCGQHGPAGRWCGCRPQKQGSAWVTRALTQECGPALPPHAQYTGAAAEKGQTLTEAPGLPSPRCHAATGQARASHHYMQPLTRRPPPFPLRPEPPPSRPHSDTMKREGDWERSLVRTVRGPGSTLHPPHHSSREELFASGEGHFPQDLPDGPAWQSSFPFRQHQWELPGVR